MSITTSAHRVVSRRATDRLDVPVAGRMSLLPISLDREAFSRGAERVARFLGTGRYLAIQSVIVVIWIGLNVAIPIMRWDPYPFILLNLAFSTQAAYAAPLILLAQNRQDDRDRATLAEDRAAAMRTREDTEFLAREVAALRLAQSEAATRQYVRSELNHQLDELREDLRALVLDAARARPDSSTAAGTGPLPAAAGAGSRAGGTAGDLPDGDPRAGRRASRSASTRAGGTRSGGERRRSPGLPAAGGSLASPGAALFSPGCRRPGDAFGGSLGDAG